MTTPDALISGRYRLLRRVGSGGMGVVWEARDERLDRTVAIKQLHPHQNLGAAEAEVANGRAMREARITARLVHPYAVSVFDVVDDEGRPCLVMQYVPSEPLTAVIRRRGPIAPGEAARIGAQAGLALAAAHRLGIVHRDVKPGNILIAVDGTARISDFGIAHALGDISLTATGMVHGTPAYLSPEVARGQDPGYASDVYGLGATLYAAVEGAPPFGTNQNSILLLHRVASGDFVPPVRSGALTPLLLHMLAARPEDRPSMEDVANQLENLVGHQVAAAAATVLMPPVPPTADEGARNQGSFGVGVQRSTVAGPVSVDEQQLSGPFLTSPRPRRRGRKAFTAVVTLAALIAVVIAVATILPALTRGGPTTASQSSVTAQPSVSARISISPTAAPRSPTAAPGQGAPDPEPPGYASSSFAVPFEVTVPRWVASQPYAEQRTFVSWATADVALRFLIPVAVYPTDSDKAVPTPTDYLTYLFAQSKAGARFTDRRLITVGGKPATIVTATADRRMSGLIGCPKAELKATDCFGLRPERRLRIAVVDVDGDTLLIWLRNDLRENFDTETQRFEETIASLRFT